MTSAALPPQPPPPACRRDRWAPQVPGTASVSGRKWGKWKKRGNIGENEKKMTRQWILTDFYENNRIVWEIKEFSGEIGILGRCGTGGLVKMSQVGSKVTEPSSGHSHAS